MQAEYKLTLNRVDLQMVNEGLLELRMRDAVPIITKINSQIAQQDAAAAKDQIAKTKKPAVKRAAKKR